MMRRNEIATTRSRLSAGGRDKNGGTISQKAPLEGARGGGGRRASGTMPEAKAAGSLTAPPAYG